MYIKLVLCIYGRYIQTHCLSSVILLQDERLFPKFGTRLDSHNYLDRSWAHLVHLWSLIHECLADQSDDLEKAQEHLAESVLLPTHLISRLKALFVWQKGKHI